MPYLNVKGKEIEVDEDGFIVNPDDWAEEVTEALAFNEGIELNKDHWRVIRYLRDYFNRYQIAPTVRRLCQETGFSLNYLYKLFPVGPAKGACKLAGIPKPAGCV